MSGILHGPVVVGIDGTDESTQVIAYGAWEAARRNVSLRLVLAYQARPTWGSTTGLLDDDGWQRTWVGDLLAKTEQKIADRFPDVSVDAVAIGGSAAAILVAESRRASLVVVGTRSTNGVIGRVTGSVAAQVATHASAPLVVLRASGHDHGGSADFAGRPVLVGIDGSVESAHAMAFAVEQAVARGVDLHATFVWSVLDVHSIGPIVPDSYNASDEREKALRLLTEATSGWSARYPDLTISNRVVHGMDAVDSLMREGERAGLIVVGSRGHGGFLGLRLGSTVDGMIRSANVPIAAVRSDYLER